MQIFALCGHNYSDHVCSSQAYVHGFINAGVMSPVNLMAWLHCGHSLFEVSDLMVISCASVVFAEDGQLAHVSKIKKSICIMPRFVALSYS